MSYSVELANISRSKVYLVKLIMDYCANTFGVLPCTATGTKCYNTFPTSKDKPNYVRTTKTYKFVSADAESLITDAKTYVKSVRYNPAEIKEDNTVNGRVKIEFYDEYDTDIGIDPYWTDRGYTSIQSPVGTFWKKFIARNSNYKKRIVEVYEGFNNIPENEFQKKFVGKIENINIQKNIVTLEAVDLLRALNDIEYPLKVNAKLAESIRAVFKVNSEDAMLLLNAQSGDYAHLTSFDEIDINEAGWYSFYDPAGRLDPGFYIYEIIAYDSEDRCFARNEIMIEIQSGHNAVYIDWFPIENASYYKIFRGWQYYIVQTLITEYYDYGSILSAASAPLIAERFYKLNSNDPKIISNWTKYFGDFEITLNSTSELDASGYLKIEKEIIYYKSISGNKIKGVTRKFNAESADRHAINTQLSKLIHKNPTNPFQVLLDILNYGVENAYIDTAKFNSYKNSWSDINFSTAPILKDTKLGKLYFDAVNMLDCISWQNEAGLITIKKWSDLGSPKSLTDEVNIIFKSDNVDLNEESRYTRILIYYHRLDIAGSINDAANFKYLIMSIDATAESANEYGDKIEKVYYTVWINDDCVNGAYTPANYVTNLGNTKRLRMRDAKLKYDCEVELKDSGILLGDKIELTTDAFNNIDGTNYSAVPFLLVKKDYVSDAKIKFSLQKI